jgi:Ca-activated chloride channel family protein
MAFAWQHRGWGLAMPFDHMRHGSRRLVRFLLIGAEMLPAVVLASVIVMLAGPQVLRTPKEERVLTNIEFCLDVSGSMGGRRYEMASDAVSKFIDAREGDAFGLTLFGSHQIRWTPLTTDLGAIRQALPFANPRNQPMHMVGTMIGAALEFCHDNMIREADQGDRMIVLVSDGFSADLASSGAQAESGEMLKSAEITLYHVHVGGGSVPTSVADLARETGGEAFAATDRKGLERIFQHIDRMRPARFAPGGTVPMDFFLPFAIVGLVALGLHGLGLLGVRYTPW